MLHLRLKVVVLVQISHALKTGDSDLVNVRHRVVGVQRLLEDERHGRVVDHGELHRQRTTNLKLERQPEVVVAEIAADLRWPQGKGHMQVIAGQRSEGERPVLNTSEAVRWSRLAVMPRGKPGKRNRNTAANRLARREVALAAKKYGGPLSLR